MAFRFFRKRQKMVIIIMVVLMVSFLIGIQGFNMFCNAKGNKSVVGTVGDEDVKVAELQQARSDIEMLRTYLGLGPGYTSRVESAMAQGLNLPMPRPTETEFLTLLMLNESRGRAEYAYALLLREARDADVKVVAGEIEAFLQQMLTPAEIESLRNRIKGQKNLSFRDLEQAIGRWLMIYHHFEAVAPGTPASELETRALFRDLNEKISLRIAKVPASKFIEDVKPPADADVVAQFEAYRDKVPGQPDKDNPFGFGYKQPDRAAVSYLVIREDVIRRVSRPSDAAIMTQYRDNMTNYTKDVWQGGGAVALAFVQALAAGDTDVADGLIRPDSEAAKQIATLRQVTADSAVALTSALADAKGTVALAVSSSVRAEGGKFGPVVTRLAQAAGRWQVEAFSVETAADAAKAEADFQKAHPGATPVPKEVVQKTYSEAEGDIIEESRREVAGERMDAVAAAVSGMLAEAARAGTSTGENPYAWVVRQMTRPADEALARPIDAARARAIKMMPLDDAVAKLAGLGGVGSICYPWGAHGDITIDPRIRVTVDVPAGATITLGQALAQIDAQVPALSPESQAPTTQPATRPATRPAPRPAATTRPAGPRLKWKTCRGFQIGGGDVLFAVDGPGGLDLLPVQAGKTDLLERSVLAAHEVLGMCSTTPSGRGGDRLVDAAFSAKAFGRTGKQGESARAEVGREAARMYSFTATGSTQMVLWQLAKVEPAFAPKTVGSVPGLRAKVVADLKQKAAYEQAMKMARDLAATPAGLDLKDEAKARGLETIDTALFARKVHIDSMMQLRMYGRYLRAHQIVQILMDRPHVFRPASLRELDLPTDEQREAFLKEAFSLAPAAGTTTAPAGGEKLVVPLPTERAAAVIQRSGYRPPVESEYLAGMYPVAGRAQLIGAMAAAQKWQIRTDWLRWKSIAKRMGYKDKEPRGDEEDEEDNPS